MTISITILLWHCFYKDDLKYVYLRRLGRKKNEKTKKGMKYNNPTTPKHHKNTSK
jgi:hypothetical protein